MKQSIEDPSSSQSWPSGGKSVVGGLLIISTVERPLKNRRITMADDIDKKEEELEEPKEETLGKPENPESDSSSKEETDYALLYEAEKERADAAEALIIKNKAISKRQAGKEGEPQTLSEERVLELIKLAKSEEDSSEEAKRLQEAQAKVKALEAKGAEIARALKNRDGSYSNPAGTHRDPEKQDDPKLPEGSPLKSYTHVGNGVYSKKLANGKTMFVNTRAMANEKKKWVQ